MKTEFDYIFQQWETIKYKLMLVSNHIPIHITRTFQNNPKAQLFFPTIWEFPKYEFELFQGETKVCDFL